MEGFATLWGLGRAPAAPATLASLAALPVAYLLHLLGGFPLFAAGLASTIALGWAGAARALARAVQDHPPKIVADAFAGQLAALTPLSFGLWHAGVDPHVFPWPGWIGGFLLFQVLGVLKPWPASRAGRLPGAAGVMLDDLAAGLLAAAGVTAAAAVAHGWI